MAEKKNKATVQQLYNTVLPRLAEEVHIALAQVIPLFDDFGLEKVVDTWTKDSENPSDLPLSLENGNVSQTGLRLQLLGFRQANVPAFDVVKDLVFRLGYSTYTIGPDRQTSWAEKEYGAPWTSAEYLDLAERWTSEIIDAIAQQLPQAR